MNVPASPAVVEFFRRVLHARGWIVGAFILFAAAGLYGATQVRNDPAIDRLIVADDPDSRAAREFDRLFPEGDQALLMLEAPDPLAPAVLQAADELERKLSQLPQVKAHSVLTFYRRTNSSAAITPEEAARLRRFASGTVLFRRAGLLGDHSLGIALELREHSPAERDQALSAIEAVLGRNLLASA